MGLFSRKSPEEKRRDKFNKEMKNVEKIINDKNTNKCYNCRVGELYMLSSNEEEYKQTSEYYKKWVLKLFPYTFEENKPKIWQENAWNNFTANNINGLLALMVLGEYDESLKYCDKIIGYEDIILETRINKGAQGGLLTVAKVVAAKAGAGGNKEQTDFLQRIKFLKAICLYELGKHSEVQNILKEYPENYGLVFKKDDDYFNQHFKYKGSIYVSDLSGGA